MKHLLDTRDLSLEEAVQVLDTADSMAEVGTREVKKLPALRGRTVVNLFFEDSTRTRISFETAEKRLSADVINFAAKGSSVSKGESLKDTAQTLEAINADAIVIRHPASGAPARLASSGWISSPVINAGDGTHAHPTQALLDAMTLRQHRSRLDGRPTQGSDLRGMRVALVGDVLHSRVARSNVWLLSLLGAHVTLVSPPTLLPVGIEDWPVEVRYSLDEAMAQELDAIMMLRIQRERMHAAFFPSSEEYARLWGLTPERLALLDSRGAETAILHPGPMNRGLEISSAAADSPRSLVLDQVTNGVSVRMSVLYHLMTGPQEQDRIPALQRTS
ncbi:aspartate carbamoyltransferase catalytic subunit [Kocuria koreensis]|jgi:aspartate carbamoyltransferase catalytic subunit|uniref:Aspartate carbamoyltransferase n=1 Tax=Rothia koreensis TaxID=592378 RepID=A0A7K1LGX1_9MICC|nr:aspartate carbamoyltransferase catalytic subunit [Rothia koreensis]MUN54388.1 aspartate carbamoyltransferase catalytic subunit [Rothia koreensis]